MLQLEGAEQEELEARKILTKRRRRVGKIEDVNIDIEALFETKKRFKPDDSTSESLNHGLSSGGSGSEVVSTQTRSLIRQNLLGQYMEQVSEHDVAHQAVLNMLKSMIKTI